MDKISKITEIFNNKGPKYSNIKEKLKISDESLEAIAITLYDLFVDDIICLDESINCAIAYYYGLYYHEYMDYETMIKYYLKAIEKGNVYAMHNLGSYYEEQGDYPNMLQYYHMAIAERHAYTMYTLAEYYEKKGCN